MGLLRRMQRSPGAQASLPPAAAPTAMLLRLPLLMVRICHSCSSPLPTGACQVRIWQFLRQSGLH